MNIIFMGTPDLSVPSLEKLYNENHSIDLVITQPDKRKGRGKKLLPTPVKNKANKLDLEVFQPKNVNSLESIERINKLNPDVIVVVAYGQILKEEILSIPKYGCINVHTSLLPKYRGAAPINWAIINGEKETGVTTMIMEKGLDTGDMLLKEKLVIDDELTVGELHDNLMNMGAELIVKTLEKIEDLKPIPQDDNLSSYAPKMDKTIGKIDWAETKEKIKNLVRGTNPFPGSYSYYKGEKFKIYKVDIDEKLYSGKLGQITDVNNEGIFVKVKNGTIIIKEVQFPGKKKIKVSEYIRGNEIEVGTILGE
ncbi:methionyl-tRNA formyltransferase [Senegalia massiliensis]|uniref:Methionyl-tRNA formyltransferase n=1 Tax=Senegalia massiliensis TaxID=1720316 RepID=A0A845QZF9_9CLOT|nr:methionyl-tRNA formyltransferase [Senegalia massiliensis]NBI06886.1 methionyl-tRNA formyltransferase [Senegalia massiliensis]